MRSRCIYDLIAENPDEADDHDMLNYMWLRHVDCLQHEGELTDQCANKVIKGMSHMPITIEDIDECIALSYEEPEDTRSENDILRQDRVSATEMGI